MKKNDAQQKSLFDSVENFKPEVCNYIHTKKNKFILQPIKKLPWLKKIVCRRRRNEFFGGFGEQASWLCWRKGIVNDYRTIKNLPMISEYSDFSMLYKKSTDSDGSLSIMCPALKFNKSGEYHSLWAEFFSAVSKFVFSKTGIDYGDGDCCMTTSWIGEARPMAGTMYAPPKDRYRIERFIVNRRKIFLDII